MPFSVLFLHQKKFTRASFKASVSRMKRTPDKPKRQRGRPAAHEATVRISPHFPASTAALLNKASALRGLTVTAFVLEAARATAERVIAEETRWRLDEAETGEMLKLLAKPPKPNAAARKADALAADVTIRS
jgi:uncharacterized protein (DUF1778 family)